MPFSPNMHMLSRRNNNSSRHLFISNDAPVHIHIVITNHSALCFVIFCEKSFRTIVKIPNEIFSDVHAHVIKSEINISANHTIAQIDK